MAVVYLGLGSNLGDGKKNFATAVDRLKERAGTILAFSGLYETAPWGFESDNNFLNAAISMDTALNAFDLLDITQQIEREMGRVRKTDRGYHDRIIDIDILLYEDLILNTPSLTLPHPLLHKRSFALAPLSEFAGAFIHPVLKKSISDLYHYLSLV
ncbi:MAG: 2-amino-4-hydroxy-6-hydroxymethyldihydropteridine diphosphokinase [Bacteroidales bacterium]